MMLTVPIERPMPGLIGAGSRRARRRWPLAAGVICQIGERVDPELTNLIASVADGDQAAFAALYDALAPTIYGVARRVLRDGTHAE